MQTARIGFAIGFLFIGPLARPGLLGAQQQHEADSARRVPIALDAVRVNARRSSRYSPNASTATRTDLPLRDTPRSVSVVTRQLIADQAMQNMADVVRYTPGVTMAA